MKIPIGNHTRKMEETESERETNDSNLKLKPE